MDMLSSTRDLVLVTAPAIKPITLSEAKAQLRVDGEDEDALIARLIAVVTAYTDAQGALGQAIITQTWGQWIGPNPTQSVPLKMGPLQSLFAVRYYDVDGVLQVDNVANYNVYGTQFSSFVGPKTGFTWPKAETRPDAIKLEYQVGFGDAASDVPDTIRHALLLMLAHWYENREETGLDELSTIPFGYEALLNMHRSSWYG
jgi:uncharacterized phiE125 gp8 family phage protein